MLARPARVLIDSYQFDPLADKSLHSITDFFIPIIINRRFAISALFNIGAIVDLRLMRDLSGRCVTG
jgi:hypothetical protein